MNWKNFILFDFEGFNFIYFEVFEFEEFHFILFEAIHHDFSCPLHKLLPPKTPIFRTRFVLPILVRSSGAHSCVHQSPICQSLLLLYAKCSGTEQTSLSLPLTHPSVFYALPCLLFTLFCVMSIEINILLQQNSISLLLSLYISLVYISFYF